MTPITVSSLQQNSAVTHGWRRSKSDAAAVVHQQCGTRLKLY
jgi:hypothetical protein